MLEVSKMVSLVCWANGVICSTAHGLSSSSRLTFLHGGLRVEVQKDKGRSCKAPSVAVFRTHTVLFPLHSVSQSKSQASPDSRGGVIDSTS